MASTKMTPLPVWDVFAHFTVNGKRISTCSAASLDANILNGVKDIGTKVVISTRESSIRSTISLVAFAVRSTNPTTNPAGELYHHINVAFDLKDIASFEESVLEKGDVLPEQFGTETLIEPMRLLSLESPKVTFSGAAVPQLYEHKLGPGMELLRAEVSGAKARNENLKVQILFEEFGGGSNAVICDKIRSCISQESKNDPISAWGKDCPNKFQLMPGNIHGIENRPWPEFKVPVKLQFSDAKEMLTYLVHNAVRAKEHETAISGEYLMTAFQGVLVNVKEACYKDNAQDNNLAKKIVLYIKMSDSEVVPPAVDDRIKVKLPYDVPDCPIYVGEITPKQIAAARAKEAADAKAKMKRELKDRALEQDTGDWIRPENVNDDEDESGHEDVSDEERLAQLAWWNGVVVASDSDTPVGYLKLVLDRPVDSRWQGPEEFLPSVGTIVPVLEPNFPNVDALKTAIVLQEHVEVRLEPYLSQLEFKNTIRGVNMFLASLKPQSMPPMSPSQLSLAKLVVDPDQPLSQITLTSLCGGDNSYDPFILESQLGHISTEQMRARRELETITNGIAYLRACFGSGKSMVVHLIALQHVAKAKSPKLTKAAKKKRNAELREAQKSEAMRPGVPTRQGSAIIAEPKAADGSQKDDIHIPTIDIPQLKIKNQVLILTETNAATDDAADKISKLATTHGLELKVIRQHSYPGEKSAFLSAYVPSKRRIIKLVSPTKTEVSEFLAASHIYDTVEDQISRNKAGDKRRVHKSLSLSEAACLKLNAERSKNVDYDRLLSLLGKLKKHSILTSADKGTMNVLISRLLSDTLSEADIVCATTAAALGSKFASAVHPTLVIVDEAPRTQEITTLALMAFYDPKVWLFSGDHKQLSPTQMHKTKPGFEDAFVDQGDLSLPERLVRLGHPVTTLYEQHRQYGGLSDFANYMFYGSAVKDATLGKTNNKLEFTKKFFRTEFNVHGNQVWLDVRGSFSSQEEATHSTVNPSFVKISMNIVQSVLLALEGQKFDTPYTIGICPMYKGSLNKYQPQLQALKNDNIFLVIADSSQGLQYDLLIRDSGSSKRLTDFFENPKRWTVFCTRSRYGDVFIGTSDCLKEENYNNLHRSIKFDPRTSIYYELYDHCLEKQCVVEMDAPLDPCKNCQKTDHLSKDCPQPKVCKNCDQPGHIAKGCLQPRRSDPNTMCRKCDQRGHFAKECTADVCRSCKQKGLEFLHDYAFCPNRICNNCWEKGHDYTVCSNKSKKMPSSERVCLKCGGKGHLPIDCKQVRTRANMAKPSATDGEVNVQTEESKSVLAAVDKNFQNFPAWESSKKSSDGTEQPAWESSKKSSGGAEQSAWGSSGISSGDTVTQSAWASSGKFSDWGDINKQGGGSSGGKNAGYW